MRLVQGDNHQVTTRDGLAVLEVWQRADLDPEQGAANARQLAQFIVRRVLKPGSFYRGFVMDMRRAPPVFDPKTRENLSAVFTAAAQTKVSVAVICGSSPIQVLQFRNLCRSAGGRAEVFSSEPEALRFLEEPEATPP